MSASSTTVHVVAKLQARAGNEDYVRKDFNRTVDAALQAQGCLSYELCEDLHKKGHLFAFGTWESEAALRRHFERNTIAIAKATEFLEAPMRLTILSAVPQDEGQEKAR